MTKTIKLALVAAMALGTTSAFATNGSALIGTGAKARGMAGIGIGMSHGAESALVNPALISSVDGTEVQFGGTIFMPDVKNENSLNMDFTGMGGPNLGDESSSATSKADMSVIPAVSLASKVNDNFYWGVGMWGTAGMGVDYRDAENTGQLNMVTNLQLMQFGVPLVYSISGFSVGVTPVLQYGALDINYNMSSALQDAMAMAAGGAPSGPDAKTIGAGVGQDLKFGVNLGLAYEIAGVTMGASYKSKIDMEYDGVLSTAAGAMTNGAYTNDKLSTPAEIGVGVSYAFSGNTIALDYKQIKWSAAEGYKDFAWDDQNVITVGYEYAADVWAVRVGYNHASSPISEQTNAAPDANGLTGGAINTFNLLGFPATVESHASIGGTYAFSKQTSVDLALALAPEVSNTYKNFMGQDITTKHSQKSVSFGLNYNF